MNHKRSPRRSGFSLIELLVVIAIIAILMASLAAAVMKMLSVPPQRNTELLIIKLAQSVDQQVSAIQTQARTEPLPGAFLGMGGGDPQRAFDLYVQSKLAQELPMTFAEAQTKMVYQMAIGANPPPPPSRFGNSFESSICLYLALEIGRRGMEFDAGVLAPKEARPGVNNMKCFFDGWDEPLKFERYVDANGNMKFRIVSAGPNHIFGDPDDVNSESLRLGR